MVWNPDEARASLARRIGSQGGHLSPPTSPVALPKVPPGPAPGAKPSTHQVVHVECVSPHCPNPANTDVTYEYVAPGVLGVPFLICAGCGLHPWRSTPIATAGGDVT